MSVPHPLDASFLVVSSLADLEVPAENLTSGTCEVTLMPDRDFLREVKKLHDESRRHAAEVARAAAIQVGRLTPPVTFEPGRKAWQSPYGPQRGRTR